MSQALKILAPTRYPWRFNSPRQSRHSIENKDFVPFNYISQKIEGVTAFLGNPLTRYDLIHAFNRIPITGKPFVIGYESHLPRGFGVENTGYFRWMRKRLASDACKGVIAISDYARHNFVKQHEGSPEFDRLMDKLIVRYPNLPIVENSPQPSAAALSPLKLLFVGNHFARKGGLVCLVLADLAKKRNIPLQLDIISSLDVGAMSWTDPSNMGYYDQYWPMMDLANVRLHNALPNHQVIQKIQDAHFMMLPTFGDTFGYSAIEAMANGRPVIATNQAALPEFVEHGHNGLIGEIPLNGNREWIHLAAENRSSEAFEKIHKDSVYELAEDILRNLERVLNGVIDYNALAHNAHLNAKEKFCAKDANEFWDEYYVQKIAV